MKKTPIGRPTPNERIIFRTATEIMHGTLADRPVAGEKYRQSIFIAFGAAGVADVWYVCVKNADNSYSWVSFAQGV